MSAALGDATELVLEVVIEIPKGSRNKYELAVNGEIYLDRTLFTATQFPADYGFVLETLAEDEDPLDTLVLLEEPTFPGCRVRVRPVGVFWMSDEAGRDPKLLCVPARDPRWKTVRDIGDLDPFLLEEISHFFAVYKQLEPGKTTRCFGWEGLEAAGTLVVRCQRRFQVARA
jgi:inorganic pyrophosphatase